MTRPSLAALLRANPPIRIDEADRDERPTARFHVVMPHKGHVWVELSCQDEWMAPRCREDYERLRARFPHIVGLYQVYSSGVIPALQGKRLGLHLYEIAVREAGRRGYALTSHDCETDGETSESAARVWKSLARTFPSEGRVLWGGLP